MNEHPPCIGMRMRDTANHMADVVNLGRYRAAREHDDRNEDTLMRALSHHIRRTDPSIAQIEHAKATGMAALRAHHSMAYAIEQARKQLPATSPAA